MVVRMTRAVIAAMVVAALGVPLAGAQEVVKIGQVEAQTGTLASYGWMGSQGAKLAVDEINKAGGFRVGAKTYKLELISPDTRGNPQDALIQLKQLLEQDKVKYVFGPFLTNVYNGIEPLANQNNGKFLMMGGATSMHAALAKPGHDYLLRTWNWDSGPSGFGQLMVDYLKKQGAKKVAMLFQNDAFGKVAVDVYSPLFKAAGIDLQIELFEPGTKDFSAPLAKLAAGKPDYLFPGYTDAVLYDIVARRLKRASSRASSSCAGRWDRDSRTRTRSTTISRTCPSISRRPRRPTPRCRSSSRPTRRLTTATSRMTRRRCARRRATTTCTCWSRR
jgi:branched-chain amino acid transport system substrate-binding protein